MELSNENSFVKNLQYAHVIDDVLIFVKKYPDVQDHLSAINMISDLSNIIMTYVNDEIFVPYTIIDREIYLNICGNIWLTDYQFCINIHTIEYPRYYASTNNNIINIDSFSKFTGDLDVKYGICDFNIIRVIEQTDLPLVMKHRNGVEMMENIMNIVHIVDMILKKS